MELGYFAGRRCAVAGGTGFVGSHMVEMLCDAGAEVRAIIHDRPATTVDARAERVRADLTRKDECLAAMAGMEVFVHAAGSVGAAGTGPVDILSGIGTYLHITANLLWAAASAGLERGLVFSSSTGYPPADHPVREEEFRSGPLHQSYEGYGAMRRYVEELASFAAGHSGLRVAVVRPGAIYGPRDNFGPVGSHVIPSLIRRAEAGEAPLVVWGTGDEVRDFLHVRDLVRGSLMAVANAPSCDPVNIACGSAVTVRELTRLVLAATGREGMEPRFDPSAPTAIPRREMDIGKARSLLGFTPRIGLEEGLAETVRWFRENH